MGLRGVGLSRACDTTIHRLRAKIEFDAGNPDHLLTDFGSGYRLVTLDAPRTDPSTDPEPRAWDLTLGDARIDLAGHRIEGPSGTARLTPNEVGILRCLLEARGGVAERDTLGRRVWGGAFRESRRIDSGVARLRAKIEPVSAEPRYLVTAIRGGYQLRTGGAEASTRQRPPLPVPADRRFGPEDEVDRVRDAVRNDRLVTLFGPGGIGKTRLAVGVAGKLAADGHEVRWVAAVGTSSVRELCTASAIALGAELAAGAPVERLARALRVEGPVVLVLDNLEQLEPAAEVVSELLSRAPELRSWPRAASASAREESGRSRSNRE